MEDETIVSSIEYLVLRQKNNTHYSILTTHIYLLKQEMQFQKQLKI